MLLYVKTYDWSKIKLNCRVLEENFVACKKMRQKMRYSNGVNVNIKCTSLNAESIFLLVKLNLKLDVKI